MGAISSSTAMRGSDAMRKRPELQRMVSAVTDRRYRIALYEVRQGKTHTPNRTPFLARFCLVAALRYPIIYFHRTTASGWTDKFFQSSHRAMDDVTVCKTSRRRGRNWRSSEKRNETDVRLARAPGQRGKSLGRTRLVRASG